jgi:DNA-binding CsgD family transcriptional regulator
MTTPMDDTLTAIGRQLSITYLPTVQTESVCSLGGSLAMQGPARTVKTTAGTVETGAFSRTKSAGEHGENCTSAGARDDVGRPATGPASTERSKSMSAVSNFATPVPGTKTPGSKGREVPPFVGNLLARWDAGYAGDRSAQSNSRVLTPRERDVLAMISQGFSNKHIARTLEISPETVKTHVKRIFLKLAVNTRTEAVCRAGSLALLGLDGGDRHGP